MINVDILNLTAILSPILVTTNMNLSTLKTTLQICMFYCPFYLLYQEDICMYIVGENPYITGRPHYLLLYRQVAGILHVQSNFRQIRVYLRLGMPNELVQTQLNSTRSLKLNMS